MRQIVGILGTPIDVLDTEAVLNRLEQFIEEGKFHQIATANTDFLINALEDPELRYILRNADLVMPDGMPLLWAAKMMRSPLPERVTGADIVPAIAKLAAKKGYRVFMLGAKPEVAQKAKAKMEADNPGLKIVGCFSPPIAKLVEMDHKAIIDLIQESKPDILLVAFGNPKQEKWIHLQQAALKDVAVCIGVGGTFDFIAGQISRAPMWMQKTGLEWLFRLAQEPKRLWKRYTKDIWQFGRYLLWQWSAVRHRVDTPMELHSARLGDCTVISLSGELNQLAVPQIQEVSEEALQSRTHLILDMQNVTGLDGAALGMLINLPKRAAFHRLDITLVAVSESIRKILHRSQLGFDAAMISHSLAEALTNKHPVGLHWRAWSGETSAIIQVEGAADHNTSDNLETVARRLLMSGKSLDIDLRSVTYADVYLLATLYRMLALSEKSEGTLRLSLGDTMQHLLGRENMLDKFEVSHSPLMPADAVEMTPYKQEIPRSGMQTFAKREIAEI